MEVPITHHAYREDGWDDSSDSSDSASDITSSENGLAVPLVNPKTSATDFDASAMYDHLRRRLEQAGAFPRGLKRGSNSSNSADEMAPPIPSLPYPGLFPRVAFSVVQDEIKSWIFSESVWAGLHLPSGLDNPYFVTSLVIELEKSQPPIQLIPAILRQQGAGVRGTEHLLMTLCCQLLRDRKADWDFPELLADFKVAFSGLNRAWRNSLLWALLQCLLTQGDNKLQLLILSLPFENDLWKNLRLSNLDRLLNLMDNTERRIKLLLLVGHKLWNTFDQLKEPFMANCHKMEINMCDGAMEDDIRADIPSHFANTLGTRRILEESCEGIILAISQPSVQPLSALSVFNGLKIRPWLSKWRLRKESGFQCDTNSTLARISEEDRPFVVDVLGLLQYCARPLTLVELAEALATDNTLCSAEENKLLDLEFDLLHSLAGLVLVQDGIVWSLHSCAAYSTGQEQLSLGKANAWLDMGRAAEMRLALRCLKYISLSSKPIESVQLGDEDALHKKRPFLHYAATFWHYHYTCAVNSGGPDDEVKNMLRSEPNVLNIWLRLQGSFYSSHLRAVTVDTSSTAHEPSPFAIAQEFGVQLDDAMVIVDLASRKLLALNKDRHRDRSFSSVDMKTRKNESSTPRRTPNISTNCDSTSLAQVAVYLPESELKLFQADQGVLRKNTILLLQTAVRQGNDILVDGCLSHITLDNEVISLLLRSSVPIESGWKPIIESLPMEERKLLKNGKTSEVGKNLLCGAIKYNRLEFVDFLMSCGFCFAQQDFMELLCVATEAGQTKTVTQLLRSHKSLPLTCALNVDTPLHRASARGFSEIAKLLLARGASVSAKGLCEDTPVHVAAINGHIEVLRLLVEENNKAAPIDVPLIRNENQENADDTGKRELESHEPPGTSDALEFENNSNSIPLEVAIRSGNKAIVNLLLRNTQRATTLKRELLHIASRCENLDVLQLLLNDQEIERNRKNKDGWYALEIACSAGSFDVAQMLITHGAEAWPSEPNMVDYPFARLTHVKEKADATRLAKLLVIQSQPTKPVASSMLLFVSRAANANKDMLVATLLDAGAEKNATDPFKRTALHYCAANGNEAGLRILLMRGADSSTVDMAGGSPLSAASAGAYLNIIRLLLERGERLSPENAEETLSMIAIRGTDERVEALRAILESHKELCGTEALNKCFHNALRRNDSHLVSLLLDYGAGKSYKGSPKYFGSALHECAYYGNVRMARLLLDHSSESNGNIVNSLAGRYYTPLFAAISWDYEKLSKQSRTN